MSKNLRQSQGQPRLADPLGLTLNPSAGKLFEDTGAVCGEAAARQVEMLARSPTSPGRARARIVIGAADAGMDAAV